MVLYEYKKKNKIFGIGFHKKKQIKAILGLNIIKNNKKLDRISIYNKYTNSILLDTNTRNISYKWNKSTRVRILTYILTMDYLLKLKVFENIKNKIINNTYKGFCHKNGLPVNGQRTHSNRYTQRRLTPYRLLKPKKLI